MSSFLALFGSDALLLCIDSKSSTGWGLHPEMMSSSSPQSSTQQNPFGFYQIVSVVLHCGEAQRNGRDVHLICFGFPSEHCVRFHTVSAHLHWQRCQVMRDLLEGCLGFRLVECLRGFEVWVKISVFLVVPLLIQTQIFVNVTSIAAQYEQQKSYTLSITKRLPAAFGSNWSFCLDLLSSC